jgi:hypothetical protein
VVGADLGELPWLRPPRVLDSRVGRTHLGKFASRREARRTHRPGHFGSILPDRCQVAVFLLSGKLPSWRVSPAFRP